MSLGGLPEKSGDESLSRAFNQDGSSRFGAEMNTRGQNDEPRQDSPFSLQGQVVLVTGASAGIGAALAIALGRAGADVACHGNTRAAETTAEAVQRTGREACSLSGDLADTRTPEALIRATIERFGRIDILINNAGTIRRAPSLDFSMEDWSAVLAVNLTSVFRLSQLAARGMLERGRGKIVNVASLLAFQGGVNVPAYAASKGGVAQLTKALSNEWAARGVNVNAIAPGYIRTDNTLPLQNDPNRNRQILERIPAGRWGEPEDLAGAAIFLSSRSSDYVNGQVLAIDGGWLGR
jgi:2-deoxy-D-gluconate 3-dehydrogenase